MKDIIYTVLFAITFLIPGFIITTCTAKIINMFYSYQ